MKTLISLLLLSTIIVTRQSTSDSKPHPEKMQTLDMYEAVIRYQVHSWELTADSYCIEINGHNPDRALLQRLTPLPVRARSGCRSIGPQKIISSVVDKKTKKPSVIFDLEKITWHGDSSAEVAGGYYCGSLCMASGIYYVERDNSGWRVIRFEPKVMS